MSWRRFSPDPLLPPSPPLEASRIFIDFHLKNIAVCICYLFYSFSRSKHTLYNIKLPVFTEIILYIIHHTPLFHCFLFSFFADPRHLTNGLTNKLKTIDFHHGETSTTPPHPTPDTHTPLQCFSWQNQYVKLP